MKRTPCAVQGTFSSTLDGSTNFTDLLGLAHNYSKVLNLSIPQLSQLDAVGGNSFAAAFAQAQIQVAVPEPGLVSLLGIVFAPLMMRRRRNGQ